MAARNSNDGDDAEEQSNSASGWSSWIQMAKNKSLSAFDLIKKDIAEFTQTVTKDTSKLVAGSSSLIKDAFAKPSGDQPAAARDGRGIHQIISSITKSYATYDDADAQPIRVSGGKLEAFDRYKARLLSIQNNPATFCTDPDDVQEFGRWLAGFDVDDKKSEIAELLVESCPIRALYTKLVPTALSHSQFWQRYFYKVHLFELDEARKTELKHRADKLQSEKEQPDNDDWDRDDDYGSSPQRDAEMSLPRLPEIEGSTAHAYTCADSSWPMKVCDGPKPQAHQKPLLPESADDYAKGTAPQAHSGTPASDNEGHALLAHSSVPEVTPAAPAQSTLIASPVPAVAARSSEQLTAPLPATQVAASLLSPQEAAPLLPPHGAAPVLPPQAEAPVLSPQAAAPSVTPLGIAPLLQSEAAVPLPLPPSAAPALSAVQLAAPAASPASSADQILNAKEELLLQLADVEQDANLDSDWEKEFDDKEDLLEAESGALGRVDLTDRDLEWESWE